MSALDDVRRALTDAYKDGIAHDGLTVGDLMNALTTDMALDAEVYPGELAMLRGLVRTLRVAGRQGDLPAVQQALLHHAVDDANARDAAEKQGGPDFFQVGRTYTDGNGFRAPELTTLFMVEHVTRHPVRGHLRAIGWSKTGEPGATWHGDFRDDDEFHGWTDVTEGEVPRG